MVKKNTKNQEHTCFCLIVISVQIFRQYLAFIFKEVFETVKTMATQIFIQFSFK